MEATHNSWDSSVGRAIDCRVFKNIEIDWPLVRFRLLGYGLLAQLVRACGC